ncbi:MAG: hypothetical protein H8E17_17930, partial [Deltaproteobacteria bacterium]|nr:hypothetical protein [Deltaproteobacteria bacterium]
MNYLLEIKQAKELLKNESYNLCSIQCGRVLESALRYLFEKFLKKADGDDIRVIKRFLSSNKKKTLNRLTLGELSTINEKTNTLQKLLDKKQDELKELNLINFKALVSIRNRATHDSLDDLEQEAGTDAHIIYGSALKILNIFSFIHSEVILEEPEVHKDKKDKRTKKRTKFIEIKEKDEGVPLGGEIELPKADSG